MHAHRLQTSFLFTHLSLKHSASTTTVYSRRSVTVTDCSSRPGPVYHEYCDCPEPDASAWQGVMQCPHEEPQILADFKSFPTVDLQYIRQEVPPRFSNRGGLIHYAIIDNQLYRRTLGKYTDFKMFSDEMLLSLTRKVS